LIDRAATCAPKAYAGAIGARPINLHLAALGRHLAALGRRFVAKRW
jgi:hypothetical protein